MPSTSLLNVIKWKIIWVDSCYLQVYSHHHQAELCHYSELIFIILVNYPSFEATFLGRCHLYVMYWLSTAMWLYRIKRATLLLCASSSMCALIPFTSVIKRWFHQHLILLLWFSLEDAYLGNCVYYCDNFVRYLQVTWILDKKNW